MLQTGYVLGAYRIETLLGRGAMGAVYRGVHVDDGALAAVKTVHADLLAGREREAMLARFRQEAQIGMRLRHPLIVQVYNCGEQDGLLYLTMELVEGQELGRLLNQQPALSLSMNLAIILQVLRPGLRPPGGRDSSRYQTGQHHGSARLHHRPDRFWHCPSQRFRTDAGR
jgi:serine/threonine-protein kinase